MLGFVHRIYKKKQLFLLISCFFPGLPIPPKVDPLLKERISTRGATSSPCNIYRSSTKSRNRSPHRRRKVLNIRGGGGGKGGGGKLFAECKLIGAPKSVPHHYISHIENR